MAGTSPAMTNGESEQVVRLLRGACHRAGQRPDPLARNDSRSSPQTPDVVIARSAQRDEAICATPVMRMISNERAQILTSIHDTKSRMTLYSGRAVYSVPAAQKSPA
jgi:hypothetical protein